MTKLVLFQNESLIDGLAELAELSNLLCELDRDNRGTFLLAKMIRDTLFDFHDRACHYHSAEYQAKPDNS